MLESNNTFPQGYIPREERKKILLLSDDLRSATGVGSQSHLLVKHTCHVYNWVQIGGALVHVEKGKIIDMSDEYNKQTGMTDSFVRIYPYSGGYGDMQFVRYLIGAERPDALMIFTDPRQFVWLFQMEAEIRDQIPILYYNIWDDLPFPKYNRDFYRSCDLLMAISKQTYNINKVVLGPDNVQTLDVK